MKKSEDCVPGSGFGLLVGSGKAVRAVTNMIANISTNSKNLNREMYTIMERMTIQAQELEKGIKEQSSRKLLSDIKNDDIRESERIYLSLEEELSSPPLDEDKNTIECDKMHLVMGENCKTQQYWLRIMNLPL